MTLPSQAKKLITQNLSVYIEKEIFFVLKFLKNQKILRQIIINASENVLFPLPERPPLFQREDKDKEFISQEGKPKYTENEFNKLIVETEKSINKELFTELFKLQGLIDVQSKLYETKKTEKRLSKCD